MSPGATPTVLGAGERLPATFLWLGVLIAVTIVGYVAIMWFRRRLLADDGWQAAESFMQELRRMRDSGEISAAEYDATRKKMAARIAEGALRGGGGRKAGPEGRRGKETGEKLKQSPDNGTSGEQI